MPDAVTPIEKAQAVERYHQSLDVARDYVADDEQTQSLDYDASVEIAVEYIKDSNADSTQKAYKTDWRVFDTWC